mmetsp:Transcript_108293/g.323843  ORF Transcript_108293/g.323843 Transcript_108293/m.323843 type:complete len:185 (+) Transcript_108293:67-621(+)
MATKCCCCVPLLAGVRVLSALWAFYAILLVAVPFAPCTLNYPGLRLDFSEVLCSAQKHGGQQTLVFLLGETYAAVGVAFVTNCLGVWMGFTAVARRDPALMRMFLVAYLFGVCVRTLLTSMPHELAYGVPTAIVLMASSFLITAAILLHYLDVIWSAAERLRAEVPPESDAKAALEAPFLAVQP